MELASSAIEDEENVSGARVRRGFQPFPLHTFSAEGVKVHFIFDVSRVVRWLGPSSVQCVLKVGSFGRNGGDFVLHAWLTQGQMLGFQGHKPLKRSHVAPIPAALERLAPGRNGLCHWHQPWSTRGE